MAVRKSAAFSADTVLSAFTRKKLMAEGFASRTTLPPAVVAPNAVSAAAAVVAPVPPRSIGSVPAVILEASKFGISAATKSAPAVTKPLAS